MGNDRANRQPLAQTAANDPLVLLSFAGRDGLSSRSLAQRTSGYRDATVLTEFLSNWSVVDGSFSALIKRPPEHLGVARWEGLFRASGASSEGFRRTSQTASTI